MTTMTWYTTASHRYLNEAPCADPCTCTNPSHWIERDERHDTPEEAEAATEYDDAPAARIVETVITTRVVGTIKLG